MGRVSSIATVAGVDLSGAAQGFRLPGDTRARAGGRMSRDAAAAPGAALSAAAPSFAALSSAVTANGVPSGGGERENKIQTGGGAILSTAMITDMTAPERAFGSWTSRPGPVMGGQDDLNRPKADRGAPTGGEASRDRPRHQQKRT